MEIFFPTSEYQTSQYNADLNVINLGLSNYYRNATSWNRTQLTTSVIQLIHVKIKIANCAQFSNIEIVEADYTKGFSIYSNTANGSFINDINYNNTNYLNFMSGTLCPTITSFYPSTIHSGMV
jgi:hypothetical protein